MSTLLNNKANQLNHCTLTNGGHIFKPNEPSDCARWPLSQMTHCGHKPNELSICTWWRLSQLKSQMNSSVVLNNTLYERTGLISADCSSQDHDKALTSCYSSNCETIENQINDYSVTISEKGKADKKTVNHRRKRDREPSRIHVKIILKRLKKRKFSKRLQSFVRQHLPNSYFISDLCTNYKTWNLWYTTDHFYN